MKAFHLLLLMFISAPTWAQNLGHGYEFENNGKSETQTPFLKTYQLNSAPLDSIVMDSEIFNAIQNQQKYLAKINKKYQVEGFNFNTEDLLKVAKKLSADSSLDQFNFYKIAGEDQLGNVHFTGYYVPVIEAQTEKDSIFRFPLYSKPSIPNSQMPDRRSIDFDKALASEGLEIAYTASLLDNYIMQVQGSGMIQLQNGTKELLSYSGTNGKAYSSIGKYLVQSGQIKAQDISLKAIREYFENHPDSLESILCRNASYTFFTKNGSKPVGAANVPLTSMYSIAVDPEFIPLGSILLAKIPELDADGRFVKHRFRLLLAQDTGGAIKGPGHVDVYFGVGSEAANAAGLLHHYGGLWLILPE